MTRNLEVAARMTYDAMAEPRLVVAVGACASSGAPFTAGYASGTGAASVLPVDVFIPGCPPRPEAIIEGLLLAVGRLARRSS
jgi:NADH:ubiquinone oxidoreductase subunit B-like Fe-S oxidoreductase